MLWTRFESHSVEYFVESYCSVENCYYSGSSGYVNNNYADSCKKNQGTGQSLCLGVQPLDSGKPTGNYNSKCLEHDPELAPENSLELAPQNCCSKSSGFAALFVAYSDSKYFDHC